jgi:nucleotide-binding universal stress UspA family protein
MAPQMKPIAKILFPMTGFDRDEAALATAFDLAETFGAHVEALFAYPNPAASLMIGIPLAPGLIESVVAGQEAFSREAEKNAREMLAGMPAGVTSSFRSEMGPLSEAIARRARLCDLVVFPSVRLPGFFDVVESFLTALTHVQRPVLVAPDANSARRYSSVAVAWNGSKSAARAVMASVPLLKRAEQVFVLSVAEAHVRPPVDLLEQYLALHGVKVIRKSARLGPPSIGDMLVQGAADLGADLLVIGGYGHSHLRESFLGGVTADVLARAAVPVFLAH